MKEDSTKAAIDKTASEKLVKEREKHATKVGGVTDDNIAKSDLPDSLNTLKGKFNARIDELKKV